MLFHSLIKCMLSTYKHVLHREFGVSQTSPQPNIGFNVRFELITFFNK